MPFSSGTMRVPSPIAGVSEGWIASSAGGLGATTTRPNGSSTPLASSWPSAAST